MVHNKPVNPKDKNTNAEKSTKKKIVPEGKQWITNCKGRFQIQ